MDNSLPCTLAKALLPNSWVKEDPPVDQEDSSVHPPLGSSPHQASVLRRVSYLLLAWHLLQASLAHREDPRACRVDLV
jgi:hypothetical protein